MSTEVRFIDMRENKAIRMNQFLSMGPEGQLRMRHPPYQTCEGN